MYTTTKIALASVTALSFTLAACGSDAEEVEIEAEGEGTEVAVTADEYDPMTRDYTLDETTTERRASFDQAAFETEYSGYRDEIVAERDTEESMAAENEREMEASGDTKTDRPEAMPMPSRTPGSNMRARSQMTWSYLDRNSDNQLSVAEYAIWAVPLDPTKPKPNDEKPPYVTAEQANKAADSFFYYDRDGDTYLSRQEFSNARLGREFS